MTRAVLDKEHRVQPRVDQMTSVHEIRIQVQYPQVSFAKRQKNNRHTQGSKDALLDVPCYLIDTRYAVC